MPFLEGEKIMKKKTKFISLNAFISYGIHNHVLHLHIIPQDVRKMFNPEGLREGNMKLIDALEQVRSILIKDETITIVAAVSPILISSIIQDMFKELGINLRNGDV